MVQVGRSGYRLDNRTIKRGSQVSILTISFKESSNLCIFGSIPFLILIWLLSMWGLGACGYSHDKLKFIKTDLTSYLSWFLFGSCPCEDLELVFISMTSSSSSKTDFEWISYLVFDIEGFSGVSFIERSNLSSFGFNLPYWTMMFPCMIL